MNQKKLAERSRYLRLTIPVYYFEEFAFEKHYTENLFPCRTKDGNFQVTVDLSTHKILEWKDSFGSLNLFSKVVDCGSYSLLDADKKEFFRIDGYVPNSILPEKDGFGDYLTLNIDTHGVISNWYERISFKDFIKDGFSTELLIDIETFKNFFLKFLLPALQAVEIEFEKLTKNVFRKNSVCIDLNIRNWYGFCVNIDSDIQRFNMDLIKYASMIKKFYLRYQGCETVSRYQKLQMIRMYSSIEITEKGFKIDALHKTFEFTTAFDEKIKNDLITKFIEKMKVALNSGESYLNYEV